MNLELPGDMARLRALAFGDVKQHRTEEDHPVSNAAVHPEQRRFFISIESIKERK
ncbi:MAG: hypothetical protein K6B40_04255 [Firmicutes bacterium]|nr:hypothetical protein [Bacillota bacterium]